MYFDFLVYKYTDMPDEDNDWSDRQARLLKGWADKSRCYSWMHTAANKSYRRLNYAFTIPAILISTFTGSANFIASGNGGGGENTTIFLGGLNIFTAMLMSTNQFLKLAEYQDRHKTAATQYSKFMRAIKTQLALDIEDREPGLQFVANCQKEFDTLLEQSPFIPDKIVEQFKKEFANVNISKPDIVEMSESPREETITVSVGI